MATEERTRYWLFKEEPTHYNFSGLEREGQAVWDGISNALALRHLGEVQPGDRVAYYHTGKEKAVVGEMVVTGARRVAGKPVVEVAFVRRWRPVGLATIKKDALLAGWDLVRLPRLSVVPMTAEQWGRLVLLVLGLVGHVLAAADERQACRQDVQVTSHAETSSTECAPRRRRNCAECSTPNRGSSALMQRKKRSLDARWKRDAENTG